MSLVEHNFTQMQVGLPLQGAVHLQRLNTDAWMRINMYCILCTGQKLEEKQKKKDLVARGAAPFFAGSPYIANEKKSQNALVQAWRSYQKWQSYVIRGSLLQYKKTDGDTAWLKCFKRFVAFSPDFCVTTRMARVHS